MTELMAQNRRGSYFYGNVWCFRTSVVMEIIVFNQSVWCVSVSTKFTLVGNLTKCHEHGSRLG